MIKFWETSIKIRVSEWEFNYQQIIQVPTKEEATKIIDNYCSTFYGGESEKLDDHSYEFWGGCPIVEYSPVIEITKEQWIEDRFNHCLLS